MCVIITLILASCEDYWKGEQYEHFVSFKAPTDNSTVTRIRVKFKEDGVCYKLPLLVSGTTNNDKDLDVHVKVDNDTLSIYNREHFGDEHPELWYRQLEENRFLFNPITHIPAGENTSLIDIHLDFNGIDLSDNWVLPLIIEDDPSYDYQSHPRLGYNNALLWLTPFNDYSGNYQATALNVKINGDTKRLPLEKRESYVVDENSIFFYAGAIDESREDRKLFKLKATFQKDPSFIPEEGSELTQKGTVSLEVMNNAAGVDFFIYGNPTYEIKERMDSETPTTMIRTLTIKDLSYTFNDPKRVEGEIVSYQVDGSMTMERRINTTIPDEEYAIEWDD